MRLILIQRKTMESNRVKEIKKMLLAIGGLAVCSFGIYLGIVANIGLVPWDSLTMGIANITNVSYGKINIAVSLTILLIDLMLRESIGVGTILDAFLTGTFIDCLYVILPIKSPNNLIIGLLFLTIGMFAIALGTRIYMAAGLSCGPRDSLLVALGKRFPKLKIGYVDIAVKVILIILSLIIKGPIGIGTLYGMIMMGFCFNIVFAICKFEPRSVKHDDLFTTLNRLR